MTAFSLLLTLLAGGFAVAAPATAPVRTAGSGAWSSPATWENGHLPAAGEVVLIRPGHRVMYDVSSPTVLRAVHIGGTLTFSRDRDTLLAAALIRVAAGEDCTEEGFDCHTPIPESGNAAEKPALEIGTASDPLPANRTAIIRLTYLAGMDAQSFPALLVCGGRMDLHGAPLSRTWVKLGEHAYAGSSVVDLAEPVTGWKAGDHLLLPSTENSPFYTQDKDGRRIIPPLAASSQTDEGEIAEVDGKVLYLKQPLKFKHLATGQFRGEVANLSRNVIVESADPKGPRGHTMYHHHSAGSISYAEFRHLGKEGVLGRYPIHFHLCGDTMRGSSVIGASIWDSGNRWLTIHGTDYLVIRDCVGFRSIGHGFFFEDGTEVFNVLDRNLAVQALMGRPLPEQMLPFDTNDAAGFWWANCMNAFTRNAAVECEKHGYRFQMTKTETFDPRLFIRQPDGGKKRVDVRELPFLRFEGNEAHSQRRFAFNLGGFHGQSTTEDLDRDGNVIDRAAYLGGDVQGVGPDASHPFRIKDFLVWSSHWGFHTTAPNVLIDGFTAHDVNYVVWRSNIAGHDYNHVDFQDIHVSTFFNNFGSGATRADQLRYALPKDTLPPVTVATRVDWLAADRVKISGIAADDTGIREVRVNGVLADLLPGPIVDWSVVLPVTPAALEIYAASVDEAGNKETTGHRLFVPRGTPVIAAASPAPAEKPTPARMGLYGQPAAKVEPIREAGIHPEEFRWPLWDGKESVADYAKRAGLEPTRSLTVKGEPIELVLVPAGTFLMGSPATEPGHAADEGPQHRVALTRPFYLGKFEVTQAQYEKVAGTNPSHFKDPKRPVEQVSWNDAQAFLQKAGQSLRLPTEAEWEFACRAGTATAYSSGSAESDARQAGWYGYDDELARAISNDGSYPVGGKAPNALGLFDMHGNVYEWCADWYAPAYYRGSPALDPQGPREGDERVLRGGSWEAPTDRARSANRNGFSPNSRGYVVGFRVAQPISLGR